MEVVYFGFQEVQLQHITGTVFIGIFIELLNFSDLEGPELR